MAGHDVTVQVSVCIEYRLKLSTKAAKTICAETIEPGEPWRDQAESAIQSALEWDLCDQIEDQIVQQLPRLVKAEIEGVSLVLKAEDDPSLEIEAVEVE